MKNRFDKELKIIMDEEAMDVYMSDELRERMLKGAKPSIMARISSMLNSYIEIPVPFAVAVFAVVIMINIIPAINVDVDFNNRKVIEIGNSQVIVRVVKDVSVNED